MTLSWRPQYHFRESSWAVYHTDHAPSRDRVNFSGERPDVDLLAKTNAFEVGECRCRCEHSPKMMLGWDARDLGCM